ncbi:MAG: hypothetical protein PVG77_04685 [Nitrosopumilaceae archaeon]|jgi:hypothetical protein
MIKTLAVIAFAVLLCFELVENDAFGHYDEPLSGYGTATIDGIRSLGEWDGAHIIPVFGGKSDSDLLLVMNDEENLYFGLYVIDNLLTPNDELRVMFDNSHNGLLDANDDYGGVSGLGDAFDGHYDGAQWIIDSKGNGAGAAQHDGTRNFIEFSKPLKSDDPNDMNISVGDIVGFCMTYTRDGLLTDTTQFGPACKSSSNEQKLYGDIMIVPFSLVWHGQIAMDADKRNIDYGEIITYHGYLYGDNLIDDQLVKVTITELETEEIIWTQILLPDSKPTEYFENTAWGFRFDVDTSKNNFDDGMTYVVEAQYVDEKSKLNFLIKKDTKPELKDKAAEAGQAIVEAGKETGELVVETGKEAGEVIVDVGKDAYDKGFESYEETKDERQKIADTVEQKSSEAISEIGDTIGGGCLIATATYGSEMAPQVQKLREIRDNKLLQTQSGHTFIVGFNNFYYSFSPQIADYERENPYFKEAVKIAITPMMSSLSILNHVDLDSEEQVLGYGISLILLNVGVYIGVPVAAFVSIKKI